MSRLRKDVEELTLGDRKVQDYDPEDEHSEEEAVSGSDEEVAAGGREHYEAVGKSKLRQPEVARLDPKYGGVPVSRSALQDDESDINPFAAADDDDVDDDPFAQADDAFEGEVDEEPAQKRTSGRIVPAKEDEDVSMSGTDESVDDQDELSEDDVDAALENGSIDESDEDDLSDIEKSEDEVEEPQAATALQQKRQELKELLQKQAQSSTLGLSQSNDAKKGRAVKRQYQTFDRLLDARIKLQKGLTAATDLPLSQDATPLDAEAESALKAAEEAALKLFNTMSTFRNSMTDSSEPNPPKKRKRLPPYDSLNDLFSIWSALKEHETHAQTSRKQILNKWSNKVKAADPTRNATKSKLFDSPQDDRLSAVLDTYVINEQSKHFPPDSASAFPVYDDNLFYQSLLRDLISTRAAASNSDISTQILPTRLHPSGNKQNKGRDTKASKGRKVRYTVHEKLQGFMAAEGDTGRDTAMWTERGKDEFFGSLFGAERMLVEDEEAEEPRDDGEEGLRLFRS